MKHTLSNSYPSLSSGPESLKASLGLYVRYGISFFLRAQCIIEPDEALAKPWIAGDDIRLLNTMQ